MQPFESDCVAAEVAEGRLEAVAVVVGERQLRACVRTFATDDHARSLRPSAEVEQVGDLGDHRSVALLAVLADRLNPGALIQHEDRFADGLGEIQADQELRLPSRQ